MEREFDETYANWLDKLVQLRKKLLKNCQQVMTVKSFGVVR